MDIEKAIAAIDHLADSWARLEEVRRVRRGLDLFFGVHKGQHGARVDGWRITCVGVHEARITQWDLGGIALYPSSHPAAQQYIARRSEVRWSGAIEDVVLTGALHKVHTDEVGDWILFDSYSVIHAVSKDKFAYRGPDFLIRAYAKALRSIGKQPQITLRGKSRKKSRPRVLHFGDSFVVADAFLAERHGDEKRERSVPRPKTSARTKSRVDSLV